MARSREFEPSDALERAVGVFWDKGYFDTSMDDLVKAMGVARYGVYGTWGNKRELFRAALQKYIDQRTRMVQGELHKPDASLAEIRGFFAHLIDRNQSEHLGCLVCNAAIEVAPHDEEVAVMVREMFAQLAAVFRKALGNAVANDELSTKHDLDGLADYLAGIIRGAAVMPRAGYTRKAVQSYLDIALSVLN